MDRPSFSVVIPAYNEAAQIADCIRAVEANRDESMSLEVVVVDNESSDRTVEIARELGVRAIENTTGKRLSISSLRNAGAAETHNSILVFLDADMIVPGGWLQKIGEYFSRGLEGALGFAEEVPASAGWVGRIWGNRRAPKHDKAVDADFLPGRSMSVNRSVFEKVNGFDETLTTCEDKDFTFRVLRAGFKVISAPDVVLIHLGYEKTLWEFLRKEFWRQHNTLNFAKRQGFSFRSLRNPMLSAWHLVFLFGTVSYAVTGRDAWLCLLLLLWILPSGILAILQSGSARRRDAAGFFVLIWLRWHVAGLALLSQVIESAPFKRR